MQIDKKLSCIVSINVNVLTSSSQVSDAKSPRGIQYLSVLRTAHALRHPSGFCNFEITSKFWEISFTPGIDHLKSDNFLNNVIASA